MELGFGSLIWEAGKLPARVREGEGGVCSRVGSKQVLRVFVAD